MPEILSGGFHIENQTLFLEGEWGSQSLRYINVDKITSIKTIDGSKLEGLDTVGALSLKKIGSQIQKLEFLNFSKKFLNTLILVDNTLKEDLQNTNKKPALLHKSFAYKVGEGTELLYKEALGLIELFGRIFWEFVLSFKNLRKFRFNEVAVQLSQTGITAIPIVSLLTFLVGLVLAYLFSLQIEKYGASIFLADAVGLAMSRELSPILVAVVVAGRSGSAFTAQIGSMKINEELDAMNTFGLSVYRILVLPRVIALCIMLPLLVLVGDIMGIMGGAVISKYLLGIPGEIFIDRVRSTLPVKSYLVGLIKAVPFAVVISLIGCRLGLTVQNNARELGIHTTRAVVYGIVAVILLDAFFAVFFQKLGI